MKLTFTLSWYGLPMHLILLLALACVPQAGRAQAFMESPMQLQVNMHPGSTLDQHITVISLRTAGLSHIQCESGDDQ